MLNVTRHYSFKIINQWVHTSTFENTSTAVRCTCSFCSHTPYRILHKILNYKFVANYVHVQGRQICVAKLFMVNSTVKYSSQAPASPHHSSHSICMNACSLRYACFVRANAPCIFRLAHFSFVCTCVLQISLLRLHWMTVIIYYHK